MTSRILSKTRDVHIYPRPKPQILEQKSDPIDKYLDTELSQNARRNYVEHKRFGYTYNEVKSHKDMMNWEKGDIEDSQKIMTGMNIKRIGSEHRSSLQRLD